MLNIPIPWPVLLPVILLFATLLFRGSMILALGVAHAIRLLLHPQNIEQHRARAGQMN